MTYVKHRFKCSVVQILTNLFPFGLRKNTIINLYENNTALWLPIYPIFGSDFLVILSQL